VNIRFDVGLIEDFIPEPGKYDAIALIFCHLQPSVRGIFFDRLVESLAPGGTLILEAFRKEQLGLKSGGPRDPEMLYSAEHLENDFRNLTNLSITAETIWLDEGPGHQGEAKVVRLTGQK
jgi:hypothetical protein